MLCSAVRCPRCTEEPGTHTALLTPRQQQERRIIKAPGIRMIGGLGYSSHGASAYLQQEQCSDSKFKSPKGIPAHTAPCVGTLWDSAGPQAAPTPPHPTHTPRLVFTHPAAKPNIHLSATWGPHPRTQRHQQKGFFNPFLHQRSLSPPPDAGGRKAGRYFPVQCSDCPPRFVFCLQWEQNANHNICKE